MGEEATARRPTGVYEVGYGKPPLATRFRKGRSGNPRGRPRGSGRARASRLALAEAYRIVSVREGDRTIRMPALQAVLRAHIALAAKGNGPAQRALLQAVQAIESEVAAWDEPPRTPPLPMSVRERARRTAFVLTRAEREMNQEESTR